MPPIMIYSCFLVLLAATLHNLVLVSSYQYSHIRLDGVGSGRGPPYFGIRSEYSNSESPKACRTRMVATNSTSMSFSSDGATVESSNQQRQQQKQTRSGTMSRFSTTSKYKLSKQLSAWWEKMTAGRTGLLLFLAPTIATQFRLLQTTVPFCVDRVLQYVQPFDVCLLFALSQQRGVPVVKSVLMGVVVAGLFQMIKDSFQAGSSWMPAKPLYDSYALVTGATSGLGKAMAFQLYEKGYNLVLVARNQTNLEDVRQEFYQEMDLLMQEMDEAQRSQWYNGTPQSVAISPATVHSNQGLSSVDNNSGAEKGNSRVYPRNIEIVSADFSNPLSPFQIMKDLKQRGVENKIDVLVANAGRGHYGAVHETSLTDIREQVEVNFASTVSLIRLMVPRMILRRKQVRNSAYFDQNGQQMNVQGGGRVVVISSVAGAGPGADIAIYAAAKAFLTTFALSIRRELFTEGILVTVAKPGPLAGTNFLSKVRNMRHVPMSFKIPFLVLRADDAASQILQAMALGREIVCPGFFTKLHVHVISKILPASLYSASVQRFWRPMPTLKSLLHHQKRHDVSKSHHAHVLEGKSLAAEHESAHASNKAHRKKLGKHHHLHRGPKENIFIRARRYWESKWDSPLIDYAAIKAWYQLLTSGNFMLDRVQRSFIQESNSTSPANHGDLVVGKKQENVNVPYDTDRDVSRDRFVDDDQSIQDAEEDAEASIVQNYLQDLGMSMSNRRPHNDGEKRTDNHATDNYHNHNPQHHSDDDRAGSEDDNHDYDNEGDDINPEAIPPDDAQHHFDHEQAIQPKQKVKKHIFH